MNHAAIDILLKMPVPRTETSPASRARDDASPFESQFRRASDDNGLVKSPAAAASSSASESTSTARSEVSESQKSGTDSASASRTETRNSDLPPTAETNATPQVDRDADDEQDGETSHEEAAEVAALLAGAEQAKQPSREESARGDGEVKVAAAGAEAIEATEKSVDAPQNAGGKEVPGTTGNMSAEAEGDAAAVNAVAEQAGETENEPSNRKSDRGENVEANVAPELHSENATAESKSSSHTDATDNAKSKQSRVDSPQEAVATAASGEKQPAAAALANRSNAAVAGTGKNTDDGPKKSERKSNARVSDVASERTTQAADSAAITSRAPDAPAAKAPIAANVPQQLATAGATNVAAAEAGVKPVDGATAAKSGVLSPFARIERGAHGAHRANKAESANHVDPARFISRVARAIQTAQEREAPVQLRLSPPELGAMRVELTVSQGSLTATIETDNANAQQLLLDNLPALRERLAEQNVKIERFDVDVRRDQTGSQQNFGTQDRGTSEQQDRSQGRHAAHRGPARTTADDSQPILRRTITNTSINVVA